MDSKASVILRISAGLMLSVAIIHAAQHFFIPGYDEFASMTEEQLDILLLFNASIALLALLFSCLVFKASYFDRDSSAAVYLTTRLLLGFWLGRLILEVLIPTETPLFIVSDATLFVYAICLLSITILLPALRIRPE